MWIWVGPRGLVAEVLDYDIVVSLKSSHAFIFTFGLIFLEKNMNPIIPRCYGLNNIIIVFLWGVPK